MRPDEQRRSGGRADARAADAAGPLPGAAKCGCTVSIITPTLFPSTKALDPTTLVAYEMNGEPLPDRHGFPARVIVPGYFGEKNVKWLTRIEVADADAEGFYEKQGWGPNFIVPIRARIDAPYTSRGSSCGRWRTAIAMKGVAFGGDRGVSRVEVSADDGENWTRSEDRLSRDAD